MSWVLPHAVTSAGELWSMLHADGWRIDAHGYFQPPDTREDHPMMTPDDLPPEPSATPRCTWLVPDVDGPVAIPSVECGEHAEWLAVKPAGATAELQAFPTCGEHRQLARDVGCSITRLPAGPDVVEAEIVDDAEPFTDDDVVTARNRLVIRMPDRLTRQQRLALVRQLDATARRFMAPPTPVGREWPVFSAPRGSVNFPTQPTPETRLPAGLSMFDPKAARLWAWALAMNAHERIKGWTAHQLAAWEFEEWENLTRQVVEDMDVLSSSDESALAALVVAMRAAQPHTPAAPGADFRDELTAGDVQQVLYKYARQHGADSQQAHDLARHLEPQAADPRGTIDTEVRNAQARMAMADGAWEDLCDVLSLHPDVEADAVWETKDDVVEFVRALVLADCEILDHEGGVTITDVDLDAAIETWLGQAGMAPDVAEQTAGQLVHLIAGCVNATPERSDLGTLIYDALAYHLGRFELADHVSGALWLLGAQGRLVQQGQTGRWSGGGGPEGQTSVVPPTVTTVPPGSLYVVATVREVPW